MVLLGDAGRLHHDHRGVATGRRANGYANVVSAAAHISNDSRSHLLGMPVHDRFEANWKVATTDRFWPGAAIADCRRSTDTCDWQFSGRLMGVCCEPPFAEFFEMNRIRCKRSLPDFNLPALWEN